MTFSLSLGRGPGRGWVATLVLAVVTGCATPSPAPDTGPRKFDVWPARISGTNPGYPTEARRLGIEGSVVAWLYVDAEGNVTKVVIRESPHDLLSEEAVSTFRKWKFKPPIENGKPASFVGEYEVRFKLTDPFPITEHT